MIIGIVIIIVIIILNIITIYYVFISSLLGLFLMLYAFIE